MSKRVNSKNNKVLGVLEYVNVWLEGVPLSVTNFFNRVFKSGENIAQEAVDRVCRWAACKVNRAIERMRQKVIRSLYYKNGMANRILRTARALKEMLTNPFAVLGAVVAVVKAILNIFIGPIIYLVEFIWELSKQIARLAGNLTKIAESLPPDPPNPHINFNAFKIEVGKMTLSTILDDPEKLPTPEEMFPDPDNGSFTDALLEVSQKTYREELPQYKMGENNGYISTAIIDNIGTNEILEELQIESLPSEGN